MKLASYESMDPQLLLGLVNTALRNDCEDLEDLVKQHNLDRAKLEQRLLGIGMVYQEELNQFRAEDK